MAEPNADNLESRNTDSQGLSRRRFLLRTSTALFAGCSYAYFEAGWIRIVRKSISVPNLPSSFVGKSFALLTDIHHGPFITLNYIQRVVALTNQLAPDGVLLAGDYVHRDGKYIEPCFDVLKNLKAPLGVFGVMGNHDHWEGIAASRRAMNRSGVEEVSNTGVWVSSGGQRLRIAGVDDFWEGKPDLNSALRDARIDDAVILLSHNPDFVEKMTDRRVGLVVSGHTHGGQVVFPIVGAPKVPSQYGQKYLHGLVKTDASQVFVSRGVGTGTPPFRFCCRPEIVMLKVT